MMKSFICFKHLQTAFDLETLFLATVGGPSEVGLMDVRFGRLVLQDPKMGGHRKAVVVAVCQLSPRGIESISDPGRKSYHDRAILKSVSDLCLVSSRKDHPTCTNHIAVTDI